MKKTVLPLLALFVAIAIGVFIAGQGGRLTFDRDPGGGRGDRQDPYAPFEGQPPPPQDSYEGVPIVEKPPTNGKKFWMSPNAGASDFNELFNPSSDWNEVKGLAHVFKFYINFYADNVKYNPVPALADANIAIAVEAGGLRPFNCTGEKSAKGEFPKFDAIVEDGGTIGYLDLDGPFRSVIKMGEANPCQFTHEEAAQELLVYFQLARERYPGVQLGIIESMPQWTVGPYGPSLNKHYGSIIDMFQTFLDLLEKEGETLDFIHADHPYNFAVDDPNGFEKLLYWEDWVKGKGIPFGVVFNSSHGGQKSNQLFYEESITYMEEYIAKGGDPDHIIFQSWYQYPKEAIPEDISYTFTNLVKDGIKTYLDL